MINIDFEEFLREAAFGCKIVMGVLLISAFCMFII